MGRRGRESYLAWVHLDTIDRRRAQVECNRKLGATVLRVRGSRLNVHADSAFLCDWIFNPDAGTGLDTTACAGACREKIIIHSPPATLQSKPANCRKFNPLPAPSTNKQIADPRLCSVQFSNGESRFTDTNHNKMYRQLSLGFLS